MSIICGSLVGAQDAHPRQAHPQRGWGELGLLENMLVALEARRQAAFKLPTPPPFFPSHLDSARTGVPGARLLQCGVGLCNLGLNCGPQHCSAHWLDALAAADILSGSWCHTLERTGASGGVSLVPGVHRCTKGGLRDPTSGWRPSTKPSIVFDICHGPFLLH